MNGWILYKHSQSELSESDYGSNRLLAAADSLGISLSVCRPEAFELIVTEERERVLLHEARVALPDFVLPRLGAETSYFGLAVIRQLERFGVYSCNTAEAISIVKDKMYMSQLLAHSRLPTPKTMLVKFPVSVDLVQRELGFPVVIKNNSGSKGFGIYLCESASNLKDLMELLSSNSNPNQIILQEFIASSYGRDLRVFVLGGRVIGCMKRTSNGTFKANYSLGGTVDLYPLTPEIEQLALTCARLFHLEIAGIDLLFDKEGFKVCEANSSPGFKGMEMVTGADIAMQIMEYVRRHLTHLS